MPNIVTGIVFLSVFVLCLSLTIMTGLGINRGASAADAAATRIEIDEQAGVIRFVIDGTESAVLDASGLHVNGSIEFTGQTVDIGEWNNREAVNAP